LADALEKEFRMNPKTHAPVVSLSATPLRSKDQQVAELSLQCDKLLADFSDGKTAAKTAFEKHHPKGSQLDFSPNVNDARQVILFQNMTGHRLSLEWLKKAAKRLLKDVKAKDPVACFRITSQHSKVNKGKRHLDELALADCQHVLALENGFDSWPKLKRHADNLKFCNQAIENDKAIDTTETVHIRCGDDLQPLLKRAGFKGMFQQIIDPFAMGPVQPESIGPQRLKFREDWVESRLGEFIPPDMKDTLAQTSKIEENFLKSLPADFKSINLWFEHDAYDQLCCAYILYHLSNLKLPSDIELSLIQVDHFPGIPLFIGLGYLRSEPASIRLLYEQRLPITAAMISFGARAWQAYISDDPTQIWKFCQEQNAPLPLMQTALLRMLQELPQADNGLGLSERLILSILEKDGPLLARRIFLFLMGLHDPQPYHGDIMLYGMMRSLEIAKNPAIQKIDTVGGEGPGREVYQITDYGRTLLAGNSNWISDNSVNRWVGGTEISSQHTKNWTFQENGLPVLK
jgi:DNA-binding PadR family transcriptional regulator